MCRIKVIYIMLIASFWSLKSTAQEKLYFEKNQDKIQAIEQLWLAKGIPVILKDWAKEDEAKRLTVEGFQIEENERIQADRKEFFSFVNDPNVLYPELALPNEWLDRKHTEYFLLLDAAAAKQNNGTPLNPANSGFIGGSPPPIPYLPVTPLTLQCQYFDMDSTLADWSTDTGFASGANPPLLGSYAPGIGTFDPLKKIQSYDNPGLPYDPIVGGTALPKIYPGIYNSWSVKLENYENGFGLSHISRKFTVDASDPWIEYRYAVVLQDPGDHDKDDRPFFEVKITDAAGNSIPCAYYRVFAKPPIENFSQVPGTPFYWRDWTTVIVPLDDYAGQDVTLHFTVGDCALGGHLAYAYIDGACLDDDLTLDVSCTPEQIITAPKGFDFYHWTGEDIQGDNYRNTLKVTKAGTYKLDMLTVTGCEVSREITVLNDCPKVVIPCTITNITANTSDCASSSNTYSVSGQVDIGSISDGYLLVTAGNQSKIYPGPFSGTVNYQLDGLIANGLTVPLKFKVFSTKHFSTYSLSCEETTSFTAPVSCGSVSFVCEDCIKGFSPDENKTYVISTWVKKENASPLDFEYTDPFVKVGFYNGSSWTYSSFFAEGEIIDGWQRIAKEFVIPTGTQQIQITLGTSTEAAFFDDLRIYPADGSFKSFVYDPITLRLVAELDENNYATFYEYDEEGSLIRIKKETERGIMTIQENRNYKVKKP